MKLLLKKLAKTKSSKERIILEFTPSKDKAEQRIMRSCAFSNQDTRLVLSKNPRIEVAFNVDVKGKKQIRLLPPEDSRPEVIASKNIKPIFDKDEYEAAVRTTKAHSLLRSLGIPLPASIAKKFSCRCGLTFVLPDEFISHRYLCPVLHIEAADVLSREKEPELIAHEQHTRKKETFECRCSHIFSNKRVWAKHQKLCTVVAAAEEIIARGKDYLDRNKDEKPARKSRSKKQPMGFRVQTKATKRKPGRKRVAKKSVS